MDDETVKKVLKAIADLDPGLQAVLNVRFGLATGAPASHAEIAEKLGSSSSDIKSLEAGALRALMGYKKRCKPDPSQN